MQVNLFQRDLCLCEKYFPFTIPSFPFQFPHVKQIVLRIFFFLRLEYDFLKFFQSSVFLQGYNCHRHILWQLNKVFSKVLSHHF